MLEQARSDKQNAEKTVNARTIVAYAKYFMEHLDELLIYLCNSSIERPISGHSSIKCLLTKK